MGDLITADILGGRFPVADKSRFANVYALIVSEEHAHPEQAEAVSALLKLKPAPVKPMLIASAKANFGSGEAERCMAWFEGRTTSRLVSAEALDWETVRANEGSWDASYRWVAREHGAIVLLPSDVDDSETKDEFYVARGQFEMLVAFLSAQKPVGVWTGEKVARMKSYDEVRENWKTRYARVFV